MASTVLLDSFGIKLPALCIDCEVLSDHRLRTVVTTTSRVNGKTGILTPVDINAHHGQSCRGCLSLLLLSVAAAAFSRSIALSGGSKGSGPRVHFVTPGLLIPY